MLLIDMPTDNWDSLSEDRNERRIVCGEGLETGGTKLNAQFDALRVKRKLTQCHQQHIPVKSVTMFATSRIGLICNRKSDRKLTATVKRGNSNPTKPATLEVNRTTTTTTTATLDGAGRLQFGVKTKTLRRIDFM
ncbi:uncharacterized protein LOC106171517 [Lingula anatina]|uniref:Uncharacterized protein LOC106171517 n=1 Tax=Lingula anatina TaxID=7574 RepID=A0A1S3JAY3_LINAN|nr:uncharacterized protein LOC106171517 [Lingula anatina]|eukprot:XP_013407356.1 uncharacterized protein LOC106171517 [Lingula anatina]